MTNNPDRVPQGSIPQVLARLKLVSELSLCEVGCWGRCRVCPADVVREAIALLTALRSLPPVPMQQVLEDNLYEMEPWWQGEARPRCRFCRCMGEQRGSPKHGAGCWVQKFEAALRSLASPQAEQTKEQEPT